MNKNILAILFILAYLTSQSLGEKSTKDTYTEQQEQELDKQTEELEIVKILQRHDPEKRLYFNKPKYVELLIDILIFGLKETGWLPSDDDQVMVQEAVQLFVSKLEEPDGEQYFISYKRFLEDLTTHLYAFFTDHPQFEILADKLYGPTPEEVLKMQKEKAEKEKAEAAQTGETSDL